MTDIEIANLVEPAHIAEIAAKLNVPEEKLSFYGKYKAKLEDIDQEAKAKLILVTAINPTPAGEGKTTVSIGLADGIALEGKKVCLALREPSLGPVFGVKGGAAGGGWSQVIPMEEINLHFTGDLHAITSANNLLSAMIDNHIHQGNELKIDPTRIIFKRCVDLNDRALRELVVGLGGKANGKPREDGFTITAASEIMAILCLASDLADLKKRCGNITVALNESGDPVYARDLKAEDAMAILLKEAIKPNLVQTLAKTPAIVHGGPFANIAHGCNSVRATKYAMALSDYTVTEAGFGADLGAEKFLDVKCRIAGLKPSCVVIVATVRALKMHGGMDKKELANENLEALDAGLANLEKHIENITGVYGLPAVVAINRFTSDTEAELALVKARAEKKGVEAVVCNVWGEGGKGATELAKTVLVACETESEFRFCYESEAGIAEKIETVATRIYGADKVNFSAKAKREIARIEKLGFGHLPVVIAKTQYSLSDDMKKLGAPKNFAIDVDEIVLKSGAGFVVAIAGNMMLMPGLPKVPAAVNMTIDENGKIDGLF